ncbi:MAG: DUF3990 domain-containing protein [Pseudoflavonifractor capillosus]|uniref:DUF3990 domain-containing protein n=1 Tax=Pseudoflavonifractor capillosus TaxID=106588 RepID=UPI0023F9CA02|nr:DUF3990 domain-containing protein [Pseudoflavonifractor capillosus]MCI5928156.1 DUF3990 domain-containing protein [Pseudoflavonifractor capillosus]MDY4660130.1 DUF3990 domain-containing protein [Pseudoflavonifractor capillosus]
MEKTLTLYHGSSFIIERPEFGKGNPFNDYGLGFYCTETLELAKEWACSIGQDGFANRYSFRTDGLSILNLTDRNYNILNWLAILLVNRKFNLSIDIAAQGKEYLASTFLPPYENYDIIIGYRADDSYFSFASAFLNNTISLAQLERAMSLGKLGEQVVLKSEQAFSHLHFEESIPAERTIYYPRKAIRDSKTRAAFRAESKTALVLDVVYMIDILREEWKNDDARLRGNVPE